MMAQYQAIRRSLPADIILLFRLGDFYEMFFEDAQTAAPILNAALTKRNGIPMCGFPHHASQTYIAKLVRANKRVALAEQTSDPTPGKLVDREIRQIISAGTIDDLTLLDDKTHNYLAAACPLSSPSGKIKAWGLACADHTTGAFTVAEFTEKNDFLDELHRLSPSELLIPDDQLELLSSLKNNLPYDSYAFLPDHAIPILTTHFKVKSLHGFGCAQMTAAAAAAGAILHYLTNQLHRKSDHLHTLSVLDNSAHLLVDTASQRNLDLVTSSTNSKTHTLLGALDRTHTPMGARKLRHWILHPLRNLEKLTARQNLIAAFLAEPFLLSQIRDCLKNIRDIERTTGRLSQNSGNARDLKALQTSLEHLPDLKAHLKSVIQAHASSQELTSHLQHQIKEFTTLVDLLQSSLVDDPPATLKDGGFIANKHSSELDELRSASRDGKQWIAKLQATERSRTSIDSLKIKFNNVFGYFIEITKNHLHKVPDDYLRKQTTSNAERYITPELKEVEGKILGADERAKQLEYDLFLALRQEACNHLSELQQTADALATLDVLLGLAHLAQTHQHTQPILESSTILQLKNARHPVLEQTHIEEKFVPNDTLLCGKTSRLHLLTGPNMAGKSTYIRQVALITIMAQIGAFVPAESATIGLADRIFCRVGASDNLAEGQSTFMVEMSETALILNTATANSLVILDEIGRGTATFDGLSIAWAVAEHLHDVIKSRTLFATHYHELCDLSQHHPAIHNFNVAVREWNDDIIFLRQIQPGPADKSYGIQVARLAGLPKPVVNRAKDILTHLELNATQGSSQKKHPSQPTSVPSKQKTNPASTSPQLDLFTQ